MGAKTGSVGNKCNAWKGNEVSYSALHKWIVLKKGSPNYCEECKISSTPK